MRKHKKVVDWSADVFLMVPGKPYQVILVRGPGKKWVPPGGKREHGDKDPVATLLREVRQETGIRLARSQVRLLGSRVRQGKKTKQHYRLFLYEACITEEQLSSCFLMSKEGEEVGLFTRREAREMREVSPSHKQYAKHFEVWGK